MGLVVPDELATLPENPSDEEIRRQKALLGLADPYFFGTEILGVGRDEGLQRPEEEVKPAYAWFDQPRPVDWPLTRRFLIYWSTPRFTAKTVSCAVVLAKKIIENPNIAIMIQCEQKDMAVATVEMIRDWLELEEVEKLYGRFKSTKGWGSDEFTVRQRTSKRRDPTVKASGLDVPMQSWHPDIMWWDDLVGETNNSLAGYKKVERRIATSMPVLRQDGMGIYTCTRWGEDDPAASILKKAANGDGWLAPGGRGFFGAYAVSGDEKVYPHAVVGEPLYPSVLPEDEIEHYRKVWPSATFFSQILNDPAPEEGRTFHNEDLQYLNPFPGGEGEPRHELLRDAFAFMAFDPAGGKQQRERGDRSALVVAFVRWQGRVPQMVVVDALGGRWSTQRCYDTFFMLVEKWRPIKIYVEKNKGENWLLDPLNKRAQSLGITLPIETIHWAKGDNKPERINALVDPYRYRQVWHAEQLRNGLLEEELLRYQPGGSGLDDFADATATLWLNATKTRRKKGSLKVGKAHAGVLGRYSIFRR